MRTPQGADFGDRANTIILVCFCDLEIICWNFEVGAILCYIMHPPRGNILHTCVCCSRSCVTLRKGGDRLATAQGATMQILRYSTAVNHQNQETIYGSKY